MKYNTEVTFAIKYYKTDVSTNWLNNNLFDRIFKIIPTEITYKDNIVTIKTSSGNIKDIELYDCAMAAICGTIQEISISSYIDSAVSVTKDFTLTYSTHAVSDTSEVIKNIGLADIVREMAEGLESYLFLRIE